MENTDFSDLLSKPTECDEPLFDFTNELKRGFGITKDLGYWHGKIILSRYDKYIAVLASKKSILLINTDYENLEHHSHLRLRTNKKGEIVLSTVDYIFRCIAKKHYPKSNYCYVCILRLLDDNDPYKHWLQFKKKKNKDKLKYRNTHK